MKTRETKYDGSTPYNKRGKHWHFPVWLLALLFTSMQVIAQPTPDLAHWQFNNNTDNSVSSLNASLHNGASFSTNSVEGSHAVSLDGSNDYVDIENSELTELFTQRSISMWVKADNTSGIQTLYEEGGAWKGLTLRINDGELQVRAREANSDVAQVDAHANAAGVGFTNDDDAYGANQGPNSFFGGLIDDVQLYNSALSAT